MSTVTVVVEFDRETTNTRRYIEVANEPLIGTLYVPKSTLKQLGDPAPEKLSVTLTLA